MAATNKKCFEKGCICASCEYICSGCIVTENDCKTGKKACVNKQFKTFESYQIYNSDLSLSRTLTKEEYIKTK